jgi:hypothetical protein
MKLQTLVSCPIYRDGGSLEATWRDDEDLEWSVTLNINSWDHPRETKTYKLYHCKLSEKTDHAQIEKNSAEHERIMQLIEAWASANQALLHELEKEHGSFNRIPLFLAELRKGNY